MAYHSVNGTRYHNYEACPEGKTIKRSNRRSGKGGLALCDRCKNRRRSRRR